MTAGAALRFPAKIAVSGQDPRFNRRFRPLARNSDLRPTARPLAHRTRAR
ncbi:hypothetical protein ACFQZ4_32110 [Catellatospora coxensis]